MSIGIWKSCACQFTAHYHQLQQCHVIAHFGSSLQHVYPVFWKTWKLCLLPLSLASSIWFAIKCVSILMVAYIAAVWEHAHAGFVGVNLCLFLFHLQMSFKQVWSSWFIILFWSVPIYCSNAFSPFDLVCLIGRGGSILGTFKENPLLQNLEGSAWLFAAQKCITDV